MEAGQVVEVVDVSGVLSFVFAALPCDLACCCSLCHRCGACFAVPLTHIQTGLLHRRDRFPGCFCAKNCVQGRETCWTLHPLLMRGEGMPRKRKARHTRGHVQF